MLLLKSLVDECDYSIIKEILKFRKELSFKICLINMLRDLHVIASEAISSRGVFTNMQAKIFIGSLFRPVYLGAPDASYCDITDHVLKSCVLIHLDSNEEKFKLLCFSISKLFSLVKNDCKSDDLDNPVFQEVLSPGQTYLFAVKEGARMFLNSVKNSLSRKIKGNDVRSFREMVKQSTNKAICLSPIVKNVISTGNMPGRNHGLMSSTGYTISLQRTNVFEVASQFSGIYKFSMQFYSKNMRKFYPESWGFLCPAHTPEGENIGLHNNLASGCEIVSLNSGAFQDNELYKLGVLPFYDPLTETNFKKTPVFVDGKILGWIGENCIQTLTLTLKFLRSTKNPIVPEHTEIVYIPEEIPSVLFPGIYIFSTPCRLIRLVKNVYGNEEFIGCFEQLMTQVAITNENDFEYAEVNNFTFLGMTASTIPFGENNATTRNIMSTGKIKQAIGFPFSNSFYRSDTKSMFLTYPQTPLVSTSVYDNYNWDENPTGTNLCIAVISYSGYDMEDAVVLNKASLERGLMHDVMYRTIIYSFDDLAIELDCNVSELEFKCNPQDPYILYQLDAQGLPYVGRIVTRGLPVLSVFSRKSNRYIVKNFEGSRPAYIDAVKLMGTAVSVSARNNKLPNESKKVKITYRIKRIPEVGDKFNNRHGQKGVCGAVLPPENLPFTADGIIPDVLFNPHGLPSRMSIGMLLEILASKAAVQKCSRITVTPFQYTEKKNASEHFGNILKDAGLDYYGMETFYSGTSGEELEADIFCGSVYYFKLLHFVEDKYQVGSVATEVDPKTMQPLNHDKVGAIRFGEMEKDAILSHGAMYLTLDRLLLCSDQCKAYICSKCETLLYPVTRPPDPALRYLDIPLNDYCDACKETSTYLVTIPYVLVYLVTELAVMGIKTKFSVK